MKRGLLDKKVLENTIELVKARLYYDISFIGRDQT